MQSAPWRHVIAVSMMAVVLVTVLMYCITPDVLDTAFARARSKIRQFFQTTFSGRTAAAESPARVRERRSGMVGLRTGPNPLYPYVEGKQERPQKRAPEMLGGAALVVLAVWVKRRGKRIRGLIFRKEERMAANLAKAVRRMES